MTRSGLTPGLLLSAAFASIGALAYGIDNGWFATALGVPAFNAAFGTTIAVSEDGTTSTVLSASEVSAGASLYVYCYFRCVMRSQMYGILTNLSGQVGIILGCLLATPISRYYGRKVGIVSMGVIAMVCHLNRPGIFSAMVAAQGLSKTDWYSHSSPRISQRLQVCLAPLSCDFD